MRRAIGLMAGPESPAVTLAMRGLRVSASMAMATKVLTSEMASAPASCAMCAICAMLVTLGESFTIRGRRAARFAVVTTSSSRARIAAELQSAVRPCSDRKRSVRRRRCLRRR